MTERGFTLIETVIVLAIFLLLMSVLIPLYIKFDTTMYNQQADIDVVHAANVVASAVQGAVFVGSSFAASHTFTGTTYTSTSTSLVVTVPSIDPSGNIITGSSDYVALYATGTTAYELIDAANGSARRSGTTTLAQFVRSLTFSYNQVTPSSATAVTTDVQTSEYLQGTTSQTEVHETAYLRN